MPMFMMSKMKVSPVVRVAQQIHAAMALPSLPSPRLDFNTIDDCSGPIGGGIRTTILTQTWTRTDLTASQRTFVATIAGEGIGQGQRALERG